MWMLLCIILPKISISLKLIASLSLNLVRFSNSLFKNIKTHFFPLVEIEFYSRRSVRVPANSSKSVAFIITPKRVGPITIKTVASNQVAGDSVESILLVEHPGATEIINKGFLFEMGSSAQRKVNVSIRIPRNSIADSAKIEISAVGDVVGSILGNLENLIRLPAGCGEQTMIQFMPNLMVLKYLQVFIDNFKSV